MRDEAYEELVVPGGKKAVCALYCVQFGGRVSYIDDANLRRLTRRYMTDLSGICQEKEASSAAGLCWICNRNEANSGEHKTKRSDLLAVVGSPTQEKPFYYQDLERRNKAVKSLDAKILKSPIRICNACNSARTQPHDLAWEHMSDRLRSRRLVIDQWVRGNRRETTRCGRT